MNLGNAFIVIVAIGLTGSAALASPSDPAIDKQEQPNVVIKLDPGSGAVSREMEARLRKLVTEAGQDERTFFRLESHVPNGGSPSLDLVRAEKALLVVRDRLVALGIGPRRILLSTFGAEHDNERDSTRHWVEIYLLTGSK